MPKLIPTQELDAIASVAHRYPGGVDAEGIRDGLSLKLPSRTLQRRLKGGTGIPRTIPTKGRASDRGFYHLKPILPSAVP